MKDNRKWQRFPIAKVASITADGLQEPSEVRVRDLSINGMGCSGDHFYKKGDKIHVAIEIPTSENEIVAESLAGEVMWVETFEDEGQKTEYAFGIKFNNMNEQNPKLFSYVLSLGDLFL